MLDIETKKSELLDIPEDELGKEIEKMDARIDELLAARGDVREMFVGQILLTLGGLGLFFLAPYAFDGFVHHGIFLIFPGIALVTLTGSLMWQRKVEAALGECDIIKALVGVERHRRARIRELCGEA